MIHCLDIGWDLFSFSHPKQDEEEEEEEAQQQQQQQRQIIAIKCCPSSNCFSKST